MQLTEAAYAKPIFSQSRTIKYLRPASKIFIKIFVDSDTKTTRLLQDKAPRHKEMRQKKMRLFSKPE